MARPTSSLTLTLRDGHATKKRNRSNSSTANYQTYGVGHGCAADWKQDQMPERMRGLSPPSRCLSSQLPTSVLRISLQRGRGNKARGFDGSPCWPHRRATMGWTFGRSNSLPYTRAWIDEQMEDGFERRWNRPSAEPLPGCSRAPPSGCEEALKRMRPGITILGRQTTPWRGHFGLPIDAVLLQQLRADGEPRGRRGA